VIGSKLLGEYLGDENIACSDIGGTSFDVALITKGNFAIKSDPDMARLVLSLPLVAMDSVGAGAGSFVRLDPTARRSSWGRTAPATGSVPAGRKAGWTRCRCPTATWCWAT
jgi:acetone carboxylase beta subunit